jgi:hypothetical protein
MLYSVPVPEMVKVVFVPGEIVKVVAIYRVISLSSVTVPLIRRETAASPEVKISKSYKYCPAVAEDEVAAGKFISTVPFVGVGIEQVKLKATEESSSADLA